MNLIMNVSDRVQVLDEGRVIFIGAPEEAFKQQSGGRGVPGSRLMLLEVEDLVVGYGKTRVLEGISLSTRGRRIARRPRRERSWQVDV